MSRLEDLRDGLQKLEEAFGLVEDTIELGDGAPTAPADCEISSAYRSLSRSVDHWNRALAEEESRK